MYFIEQYKLFTSCDKSAVNNMHTRQHYSDFQAKEALQLPLNKKEKKKVSSR